MDRRNATTVRACILAMARPAEDVIRHGHELMQSESHHFVHRWVRKHRRGLGSTLQVPSV